MSYTRANTDWLASCRYGIGFHWTAQTTPRHGQPLPFHEAVARFDLDRFLGAVDDSGADPVIFTLTHALQMLPCPSATVDELLPGRTTRRDLVGEIADALARRGRHFIAYYNHSCNNRQDHPWERAVGYHDASKERLADNLCRIVAELGQRYGSKMSAWWFDSSYALDPRGPHNAVTTDMTGFKFPWERWTAAAKAGHPQRLVTYNAGINETFLYTDHQDYWAGEMVDLQRPPRGRRLDNGLQWHGWARLDSAPVWFHRDLDTEAADLLYTDDQLVAYLSECMRHQAPMCFNVTIFQDGVVSPRAVEQLRRVGARLGAAGATE